MPAKTAYKSFGPLLKSSTASELPPYRRLLALAPDKGTEDALLMVQTGMARSKDLNGEIAALLADVNWRVHVIAASAVLLGARNDTVLDTLWEALDCGSGAAAQLAVTAYLCDRDFEIFARERIENGCTLNREKLAERANARLRRFYFPERFGLYSPKSLVALVALCKQLPGPPHWLTEALAEESIQKRLKEDWERTDVVTASFLRNATRVLAIEPPASSPVLVATA